MSYAGYVPLAKKFLDSLPVDYVPAVLEVGIEHGSTLIPLVSFLNRTRKESLFIGVDVKIQDHLTLTLRNLDIPAGHQTYLFQMNSLEALPKFVEQKIRFDLFLLDGDHNYYTVSKELERLEELTYPHSIVIIDDYNGRWSEQDLWYAQRPGYEGNAIATSPVEGEKHGVKAAVDEFLTSHPEWQGESPITGEPILLSRRNMYPHEGA